MLCESHSDVVDAVDAIHVAEGVFADVVVDAVDAGAAAPLRWLLLFDVRSVGFASLS